MCETLNYFLSMANSVTFMTKQFSYILFFLGLFLVACQSTADPYEAPTFDDRALNVVVETPAGEIPRVNGEKEFEFLPYPGNFGRVASTCEWKQSDGSCNGTPVLIIAERMEPNSLVKVVPIGALMTKEGEWAKTLIVGKPLEESARLVNPKNFMDFVLNFDDTKRLIQEWALSYSGKPTEMLGWENREYAIEHIKRFQVKK